ncbi:MAG: antibiotic biosynthesis monooxygenase [SAR202 cluster bacterium]|nr:antibiotic biosynthesis monooxygenase [SAR202 cluster bacterium]
MIAVLVSIRVRPGLMDRFIEATLDDARGSVRDEPGCYRFDVLRDAKDANLVHLYEVYTDESAREAHRKMPHYLEWGEAVKEWRDGPSSRIEMGIFAENV